MGKMRFDNLKPLRFWGFSMVFLMWVSMGKAKRCELLFPEEKVGFEGFNPHLLAKTHIFLDTIWGHSKLSRSNMI